MSQACCQELPMADPHLLDPYPTSLYLSPEKDDLYAQGQWPKPFVFNEEVARVFDDMVSRSIPLYREVLTCAALWSKAYYQPGTRLIDVGCSTGTLLELLGRCLPPPASLVGIDNSLAMINRAQEKLKHTRSHHQVELLCQSADEAVISDSSVVILNYILQFLPLQQRQRLLRSIRQGLVPGGMLFLSEKVVSPHPHIQETVTRHYEAFKAHNGYAQTEIERKKEALEQVLVPLTEAQQVQMLLESGFAHVESVIKLHNFVSWVALV